MAGSDVAKLYQSTKDLAKLINIQKTAINETDIEKLYDHIVHLSRELVDHDFAALILSSNNQVVKVSDAEFKKDSLITTVIKDVLRLRPEDNEMWSVTADVLSEQGIEYISKYLFEHTLVLALKHHNVVVAEIILSRKVAWDKRELVLLDHLRSTFAISLASFFPDLERKQILKKKLQWLYQKKVGFGLAVVIVACLFLIRVPLTVIAPAEVTSRNPVLIQSSIDGVIDQVHATPNIHVKKGDKLVSLDQEKILSQLNILQKRQDLIQTQYKIASKLGIRNEKEKQNIPIYNMELKKNQAEIDYYQYLLSQTSIKAPKNGLVLFDHVHKLEGKPIRTGESIMLLADESDSALDIYLPV
ncbi:MAG: HlyD family secretion protein, partial [Rickettsiales bacterium]|nr:HlyD family secretion protein [Rickettsiales bacterium]